MGISCWLPCPSRCRLCDQELGAPTLEAPSSSSLRALPLRAAFCCSPGFLERQDGAGGAGPRAAAPLRVLTASTYLLPTPPPHPAQVAPTFLLYKNGEQVASMTGAKTEQLRDLIEQHM